MILDRNTLILSTGCQLPNFRVIWYKMRKDFTKVSLNVTSDVLNVNDDRKNDAESYLFEYIDTKNSTVFASNPQSQFVKIKCKLKIN